MPVLAQRAFARPIGVRRRHYMTPLLTAEIAQQLQEARQAGQPYLDCSLDLERSVSRVSLEATYWLWNGARFAYPQGCKDRTIYLWHDGAFHPVSRYKESLIKLIPTPWGAPTFEIDGVKMLPSAATSPFLDAQRKVELIEPRGKAVLDCCGGLGYFAASCLQGGAARIASFEKNPDVIWLRSLNPWSPGPDARLTLTQADVAQAIEAIPAHSIDAILHDPPRFALAGNLYSETFYGHLARVIKPRGLLFHYTGSPNKISHGRDLAGEVLKRLASVGFDTKKHGDGVIARRLK